MKLNEMKAVAEAVVDRLSEKDLRGYALDAILADADGDEDAEAVVDRLSGEDLRGYALDAILSEYSQYPEQLLADIDHLRVIVLSDED